ncbi:MAG: hypothetical protein ACFCUM_08470 [Bacteroidales bacterium]
MKKYTVLSLALIFGLFLMTDLVKADDHDKNKEKKPIAVNNLPEEVREAVQEDYDGFRITEAFHVTKTEGEVEGMQHEGMQQREGAERTTTQREGVQQHEGAERTATQREGVQQREGAESTEGIFSSDDEDSYYELSLAKGQETKTVKYNEEGDELDKDDYMNK